MTARATPGSRPWARGVAVGTFTLVLGAFSSALWFDSPPYVTTPDVVWASSFTVFPAVGLVLALHRPRNPIGWLFMVGPGALIGGVAFMEAGLPSVGDDLFGIGLLLLLAALLLFPDGRYPGRIWRWAHGATAVWILWERWGAKVDTGGPIVAAFLITLGSLVYRVIRGPGEVRRQIALPAFVAVLGVTGAAVSGLFTDSDWAGVLWSVVDTAGVPIAIALSILKYRLYEIDRIVSRTVSYALVAAVVGLVYAAPVVLLPRTLGGSTDLVVAGATLAAAAAFNPARRRIQRAVERRFDRSRYDAGREVEAFATRLRAGATLDTVRSDVDAVLRSTLGPHSSALWIREVEG